MNKLNFAFAALILFVGVPSAQADDSGHISINTLNAELPRSNDPLSPVSDGLRASSRGQDAASWDGTWNGTLGKHHPWPISVSIANGKVVGFTEKDVSFDVRFVKVTPTSIVFGDKANYTVTLTKTGDTTTSAEVYGRRGSGTVLLTKG